MNSAIIIFIASLFSFACTTTTTTVDAQIVWFDPDFTPVATLGGTPLTIVGSGWNGVVTAVTFSASGGIGDMPNVVLTASASKVVCITPAHSVTAPLDLILTFYAYGIAQPPSTVAAILQWTEPTVTTPALEYLPLSGNYVLTMSGTKLGTSISAISVFVSAGIGYLSCSLTVPQTQFQCNTPAHAASGIVGRTVRVGYLGVDYMFYFPNSLVWMPPVLSYASPSTLPLSGGVFELQGWVVGFSSSFYTSANTDFSTGSVVGVSNNNLVHISMGPRTNPNPASNMVVVTLSWTSLGGGSIPTTNGVVSFVKPIITSVSPSSIQRSFAVITIYGDFFGTLASFYCGSTAVSIADTFGTSVVEGSIMTITNTMMVASVSALVWWGGSGCISCVLHINWCLSGGSGTSTKSGIIQVA